MQDLTEEALIRILRNIFAELPDDFDLDGENEETPEISPLSLDDYQRKAHTTSRNTQIGGDALLYPVLGLVGEAGELANRVKKIYRDFDGKVVPSVAMEIQLELGDVLWYVAEICTQAGMNLADVADLNLAKLAHRARNNTISGSGDER